MDTKLTRLQFNVLAYVAEHKEMHLKEFEAETGMDSSECACVCAELEGLGYIHQNQITAAGLEALEPHRVKRAIFIAAGFGSRLVPITLNTPKPLVRVRGTRMIDTLIDAVLKAGIDEIIIVRGYLYEQFDQLLYKYPTIKFVDNLAYDEANNIMSIYRVRNMLENAYVFEADLVLSNPKIIKKYQYSSCFLGIPVEKTNDWCFEVEDGIIKQQMVAGKSCYQQVGISYWNAEDGHKLASDIDTASNLENGKELYWDQVPMKVFKDRYNVEISSCSSADIVEIDTFDELRRIDKMYEVNME